MAIYHVICITKDGRLRRYELYANKGSSDEALLKLIRKNREGKDVRGIEKVMLPFSKPCVLRRLAHI